MIAKGRTLTARAIGTHSLLRRRQKVVAFEVHVITIAESCTTGQARKRVEVLLCQRIAHK